MVNLLVALVESRGGRSVVVGVGVERVGGGEPQRLCSDVGLAEKKGG